MAGMWSLVSVACAGMVCDPIAAPQAELPSYSQPAPAASAQLSSAFHPREPLTPPTHQSRCHGHTTGRVLEGMDVVSMEVECGGVWRLAVACVRGGLACSGAMWLELCSSGVPRL